MTNSLKLKAVALAASLVLGACGGGGEGDVESPPAPPAPAVPESAPVAGVLNAVLCNSTIAQDMVYIKGTQPLQRTLTGEQCIEAQGGAGYAAIVDLVLFDKSGAPIDFVPTSTSFTEKKHSPGTEPFLTFVGHSKVSTAGKEGGYSAFLAFDQSGSISSTDPSDQRIAAGTLFLEKNTAPDEVALGYFPGSSHALSYFAQKQDDMFSSDTSQHIQYLKSLAGKETGGTPLYNALAASLDLTSAYSRQPNKAVVAFSDGMDTASSWSIDGVITSAKNKNIPLYLFALAGSGQDFLAMQRLATETGGAMLYASSARQLMAAYGSLGNLLRGNTPVYRLVVKARDIVQDPSICKDEPGGFIRVCQQAFDITAHTPAGDIDTRVNFTVPIRLKN